MKKSKIETYKQIIKIVNTLEDTKREELLELIHTSCLKPTKTYIAQERAIYNEGSSTVVGIKCLLSDIVYPANTEFFDLAKNGVSVGDIKLNPKSKRALLIYRLHRESIKVRKADLTKRLAELGIDKLRELILILSKEQPIY